MNRRVFAIVVAGLIVVSGAIVVWNLARSQPEPKPSHVSLAPDKAPPTPPAAAPEAPKTAAPSVTRDPSPRPARRALPSKPEPTPAAAPAAPEAAPSGGSLHIDSDVRGAQVFIDREYIGVTPLTAPGVKPGSHRLNVSAPGYEGVAETIEVSPGPRDIVVRLKDVRLDAQIDVVHKHRIGSCKGRLVATAHGLRYETANKDDAFSAALLELGTFQIDYLEKNLRIVAANGKRYDFADPQGNADRLFVFHRDVEKARERLKKGDAPAGQ